eukprot:555875-Pleurochrysis_carterae.AAC.1
MDALTGLSVTPTSPPRWRHDVDTAKTVGREIIAQVSDHLTLVAGACQEPVFTMRRLSESG